MTIVGFILVAFGVLTLVFGGISYERHRASLDVGPSRATATKLKAARRSPLVGGIAVISGLALLWVPRKRAA